jgi:hypothetical protein
MWAPPSISYIARFLLAMLLMYSTATGASVAALLALALNVEVIPVALGLPMVLLPAIAAFVSLAATARRTFWRDLAFLVLALPIPASLLMASFWPSGDGADQMAFHFAIPLFAAGVASFLCGCPVVARLFPRVTTANEPPTCRCGYDLRGLNHVRCPECGRSVA